MEFLSNTNIQFYIAAYLIGSIPFGLLLAKQFAGVNIKKEGSKNIGATNVLRVVQQNNAPLAKKLGIATLILDTLKGMVILLLALLAEASLSTLWAIAVFSVLGHCYSIYLNFEGGKGVATGLGVLIILIPIPTLVAIGIWLLSIKTVKISSISSLLAILSLIVVAMLTTNSLGINSFAPLYLISFIILYKHIPNLFRFVQGKEKKVI